VTLIAALCNVGLNLWLVPDGGIVAAAVSTAVGYTVLATLMTVHAVKVGAQVVTPLWGPTSKAGAVVVLGYIAGKALAPSDPGADLLVQSTLMIVVTLILLGMTRILSSARSLRDAATRRRPGG
jgi:O-antigen/teichoic acid export membrane protein